MTLREKRILFTQCLVELISWINAKEGYAVALGRDGEKHMAGSLHYQGLANDLIIYRNGSYLDMTEDYKFAGEKWKSMHPLCRWGGDFKKADGNHFSVEFEGKA